MLKIVVASFKMTLIHHLRWIALLCVYVCHCTYTLLYNDSALIEMTSFNKQLQSATIETSRPQR